MALAAPGQVAMFVLIAIAATLGLSGLIILGMSRGRHLAWPVFLAAAGLALVPVFG